MLVVGLDVLDLGDEALADGARVLAAVNVDGMDDVLGHERLAVVELHALAQLEDPLGGVVGHLPAFRQFAHDLAVRGHLGDVAQKLPLGIDLVRIAAAKHAEQGVGVRAAAQRLTQLAALLRRSGLGLFGQQGCRNRRRQAEGRGTLDEITT